MSRGRGAFDCFDWAGARWGVYGTPQTQAPPFDFTSTKGPINRLYIVPESSAHGGFKYIQGSGLRVQGVSAPDPSH